MWKREFARFILIEHFAVHVECYKYPSNISDCFLDSKINTFSLKYNIVFACRDS